MPATGRTFTVATFNVHMLWTWGCPQTLLDIFDALRDAGVDVAALQEAFGKHEYVPSDVWTGVGMPDIDSEPAWKRWWQGFLVRSGVMTLSRTPVVGGDSLILPRGTRLLPDSHAAKCVLWSRVQLPGDGTKSGRGHVHVFNLHLQANYGMWLGEPAVIERQLAAVAHFIRQKLEQQAGEGAMCDALVLGDFNVCGKSEYGRGQLMDAMTEAAGELYDVTHIAADGPENTHRRSGRVDHIFYLNARGRDAALVPEEWWRLDEGERELSDHWCVCTRFRVQP